jgi:hypothetical protein
MKTKEEIEQLGSKYATTHEDVSDKLSKYLVSACFQDGYTQCQEDMLILLRSEIKRAYQYGQTNAQMMEVGIERDEIEEYVNYRMLSFKNK